MNNKQICAECECARSHLGMCNCVIQTSDDTLLYCHNGKWNFFFRCCNVEIKSHLQIKLNVDYACVCVQRTLHANVAFTIIVHSNSMMIVSSGKKVWQMIVANSIFHHRSVIASAIFYFFVPLFTSLSISLSLPLPLSVSSLCHCCDLVISRFTYRDCVYFSYENNENNNKKYITIMKSAFTPIRLYIPSIRVRIQPKMEMGDTQIYRVSH